MRVRARASTRSEPSAVSRARTAWSPAAATMNSAEMPSVVVVDADQENGPIAWSEGRSPVTLSAASMNRTRAPASRAPAIAPTTTDWARSRLGAPWRSPRNRRRSMDSPDADLITPGPSVDTNVRRCRRRSSRSCRARHRRAMRSSHRGYWRSIGAAPARWPSRSSGADPMSFGAGGPRQVATTVGRAAPGARRIPRRGWHSVARAGPSGFSDRRRDGE